VIFKDHIVPICLPNFRQSFIGKFAKVIGWGRKEHGNYLNLMIKKGVCYELLVAASGWGS